MATVYRGFDEMLQVERAIKVLSQQMARNEKIRTRFLAEARMMARLKHVNIVGVYDVGMEGDAPFIVMEMIEGGAVMDWVRTNGPMPPLAAVWTTIGVLRALTVAHDNGIVHRDVKPHNVLLTKSGIPKLTDFGIAQSNSKSLSLTRTGAVMGTMAYMSPEQRRNTKEAGVPADIYATGASLYVMVTGEEPFDLYSTELSDELYGDMQQELRAVIQIASSYRKDDRYQTAKEMEDALLAIVDTLPPTSQVTADGRVILQSSKTAFWEPEDTEPSDPFAPQADSFVAQAEPFLPPVQPSKQRQDTGTIDFDRLPSTDDEADLSPKSKAKPIAAAMAVVVAVGLGLAWFGNQDSASTAPAITTEASITEDAAAEAIAAKAAAYKAIAAKAIADEAIAAEAIAAKAAAAKAIAAKAAAAKSKSKPKPDGSTKTPSAKTSPTPAATETKPPPADGKTGTALIGAEPYANVTIDGKAMGRTGWRGKLSVGSHKLVLTTKDGRSHSQTFAITEGKKTRLCWNFDQGSKCIQ
jgi:serine/threonine protein kinase